MILWFTFFILTGTCMIYSQDSNLSSSRYILRNFPLSTKWSLHVVLRTQSRVSSNSFAIPESTWTLSVLLASSWLSVLNYLSSATQNTENKWEFLSRVIPFFQMSPLSSEQLTQVGTFFLLSFTTLANISTFKTLLHINRNTGVLVFYILQSSKIS